jgi:hypothetical protein
MNGELSVAEIQRRKNFSQASLKHGQYKTPEYWAWLALKQRCYNPRHPCFALYGGRGLTVCDRWRFSFENFLSDMGKRPTNKHTVERIDNLQGYSPENCEWRTQFDQLRNTRKTIHVTLNGATHCLKDWCIKLGINYGSVQSRIGRGWDIEKALLSQIQTQFRKHSYGKR